MQFLEFHSSDTPDLDARGYLLFRPPCEPLHVGTLERKDSCEIGLQYGNFITDARF